MPEGISKKNVILKLYEKELYSDREWMYTRGITRELVCRPRPKESELNRVSKILLRQRRAGRVKALNAERDERNNGRKLKYALTENGRNYAKILNGSDWYCEHCQDFVEAVKKPTCKNCGTPVHRKER
ncbi:hypothetical protein AKJ56_01745 [candidate division MSBL1 archaeon SCGC-AAA382N08]|uniref:Uncharacterized protein n=1 Tax=candidate division MSBL1 archaeon SCGC-AAA382N08 TaxID=1698285 RepID=A0A133VNW6_9EURY|nr:hypothetical protein AKJ56_01745 [candidate division MSBL1 archaeon SCGC-AAA382N08]